MLNIDKQKFNKWTILKEVGNGKVECQCECGKIKIVDKYSIKSGKSTSCGCSKYQKLKGKQFNNWEVLEDIDRKYALCKCICGNIKKVQREHLKNGTSASCGCMRVPIKNRLTNKKIGYWTVEKELGNGKVLAKCDCGTVKEIYKYHLQTGATQSCGCMSSKLKSESLINNLENQTINEWTILEELGKGLIRCRCSCGNIKTIEKGSLLNGTSKSCGHNTNAFNDLTNKKINSWTIIQELGQGKVLCKCECGTIKKLQKALVVNGYTKSCGCNQYKYCKETLLEKYGEVTSNKVSKPRETWQIEAISSKEKMQEFIELKFKHKPTVYELTLLLGITASTVGRLIKEYEIQNIVKLNSSKSKYEIQIYEYINSIYDGKIETNVRCKLGDTKELDIYIPEKKLAIEFNGSYWHSNIYKDKYYHQQKTINAAKQGMRLIHIFEYEWIDEEKQRKIKALLKNIICNNEESLYARSLKVKEIDIEMVKQFEDAHHLQGSANSSINIALVDMDSNIRAIMTFSKPRFNKEYQYELIRLCYDDSTALLGGAEKLFSYFLKTYKPESIITYTDISKFTGNVYTRLNFKPIQPKPISEPSYVWVSLVDNEVLSRYQTQKHKLVEKGLGTENETENEIMENNNFIKIYDCGNLKLEWRKEN